MGLGHSDAKPKTPRKRNIIKKTCEKCKRTLGIEANFYKSKNAFSTDGYTGLCRICIQNMIDKDNIESVYKVLQLLDLPFFYDSWITALEKVPNNPFGKYITMANSGLNDFKGAKYEDSWFEPKKNDTKKAKLNITAEDLYILEDKWGDGYSKEQYILFEKKYNKLERNYGQKTELHTEAFKTYIRFRVLEEMSTAKGQVTEAGKWAALANQAATNAKINVSQLSKSDISGGVDVLSQLFEAIETEAGIIPLLPCLVEQPYDDADMIIWCTVNYNRRLEDKPRVEYKEIWNFYDEMFNEFWQQKGLNEEQIAKEKEKRNAIFRDMSKIYREPIYEEGDI